MGGFKLDLTTGGRVELGLGEMTQSARWFSLLGLRGAVGLLGLLSFACPAAAGFSPFMAVVIIMFRLEGVYDS